MKETCVYCDHKAKFINKYTGEPVCMNHENFNLEDTIYQIEQSKEIIKICDQITSCMSSSTNTKVNAQEVKLKTLKYLRKLNNV